MGLEGVRRFLRRHRKIALDTSVFIYQLEAHPKYLPVTDPIFAWLESAGASGITSSITMAELLVKPYRDGDRRNVALFYALFSTYPNLQWIAPDLEIADTAARLRALHRLSTPDAIQSATAIHRDATGLITNDDMFERVGGFETLVLERFAQNR